MKLNHNTISIVVVTLSIILVYSLTVFLGYAALFGIFQFLRDKGYGFWEANAIMVLGSCFLAIPSIVIRLQSKK